LRNAARALDAAVADLGDDAEPHEHAPEDAELDQEAGHEHLPCIAGRKPAGLRDRPGQRPDQRLQQWCEQRQVQERLDHDDRDPGSAREARGASGSGK
jgi:hypothetical protein